MSHFSCIGNLIHQFDSALKNHDLIINVVLFVNNKNAEDASW